MRQYRSTEKRHALVKTLPQTQIMRNENRGMYMLSSNRVRGQLRALPSGRQAEARLCRLCRLCCIVAIAAGEALEVASATFNVCRIDNSASEAPTL